MLSSQLKIFCTEKLVPGLIYWEANRKLRLNHWYFFFLEPQLSSVLFNGFSLFFPPFFLLFSFSIFSTYLKLNLGKIAVAWNLRYSSGMVQHQIQDQEWLLRYVGAHSTKVQKCYRKVCWNVLVRDHLCRPLHPLQAKSTATVSK